MLIVQEFTSRLLVFVDMFGFSLSYGPFKGPVYKGAVLFWGPKQVWVFGLGGLPAVTPRVQVPNNHNKLSQT